jgi:hypothetical protein
LRHQRHHVGDGGIEAGLQVRSVTNEPVRVADHRAMELGGVA